MFRIGSRILRILLCLLPCWLNSLLCQTISCAAETVQFERDILPIFQQHCLACHGADEQQSGLRLDQRSSMLRGGDHGRPTIVVGKPLESFLLAVVSEQPEADVDSTTTAPRMPPEGKQLSARQVELLREWIASGADWPGQMEATADDIESDLWSLQPVKRAESPALTNLSQSIDHFITDKLSAVGLAPAPLADPATLLRRVSLVLTGLPPTPDELHDFLHDPAGWEHAYESAVERLLASPRYGERWAQHWLDVIRWAETVGFETNAERTGAWPYRDWVIAALNDDKPYDQFIFEQIAGDTLSEDAALGFLVAGPANLPDQVGRDQEAMRQARQDELDEVIGTVSQAVLGLTVGCARCHNHKFDPILQRDYYSLQAIFAGMHYGQRRWRGETNDLWTKQIPAARELLEQRLRESQQLRAKHGLLEPVESNHTDSFDPVVAQAVRMTIQATGTGGAASLYELEVWSEGNEGVPTRNVALAANGAVPSASSFALANQTRHFDNLIDGSRDRRQAFPWEAATAGPAWVEVRWPDPQRIDRIVWERGSSQPVDYTIEVLVDRANRVEGDDAGKSGAETQSSDSTWLLVAASSNRYLREDDHRGAESVKLVGLNATEVADVVAANASVRAARVELERLSNGPRVYAAVFSDPPEATYLLSRGDPMSRREEVRPAIPVVLGDLALDTTATDVQRRLALARHLTSAEHPLTARVIVNRVWQHHFGRGLVDTPSDFGEMGSPPTHAELLDTLAHAFVHSGWSLKDLHRQIVMSQTFRQSNRPLAAAIDIDADCRLLWRYPPRRMEAEAIRDGILQASGNLNLHMGGPGFNLFQQRGGLSDYQVIETFDEAGWRRMIYAHKVRMQSVDVFGPFDCPDAGQMQPKRTRSITPTQSLGLLNSPFVLQQAERFAQRVRSIVGTEPVEQLRCAFRIAYSRPPDADEERRLSELIQSAGLEPLCRAIFNSSEFLTLP